MRAINKKSKLLIALLAAEAKLINAIINLGTSGDAKRFTRAADAALRNVIGMDVRGFIEPALEETARVLADQKTGSVDHLACAGVAQSQNAVGAGSPDFGVGGEEDGDHRHADGSREMRDPGVDPDINTRAGEPATELVKVIISDSVLEKIFGSGDPFDTSERGRDRAEILEGPILSRAS